MLRQLFPVLGVLATSIVFAQQPIQMRVPAPELREIDAWINSKPLTLKSLKGKVVALNFWTFG